MGKANHGPSDKETGGENVEMKHMGWRWGRLIMDQVTLKLLTVSSQG